MKKKPEPSTPPKKTSKTPAGAKKVPDTRGSPQKVDRVIDWEAVFRLIGTSAMIVAPDHSILAVNDATCRISGKAEHEIRGMKCWEVFHGPDATRPPVGCPMERTLSSGKHETSEMEVSINGGVYLVSCTPVHDKGGAISSIIHIATDITEKKEAEKRAQEREKRFRKIFENSPIGMVLVTPDFRFFSVNPAWVSMTGYSEKELLKMSFTDITHPDHLAGDVEHIRELAAGKIPVYATEKRYIRKDRSILWGVIRVTAIRDHEGTLRYFAAQIEDITDRKKAEEKVRKTDALLNETQKISHIGGWEYEVATGRVVWTDEVYRIYGVGRDFDPGTVSTDIQFYTPRDAPIIEQAFRRCLEQGEPYDLKLELIRADGRQIWVRTMGKPVLQEGKIVRVHGNIMDITELQKAEILLRESERKYHDLYLNSALGIFHSSLEGKFIDLNPTLANMLGYSSPEEVITSITSISEQLYAEPCQYTTVTTNVVDAGRINGIENHYRRRDGTLWYGMLYVRIVPGTQGRPSHYEGFVEDITLRKQLEEQRERLIRELAQKNTELDQFTYTVSHDLKSPLTTIRGFASLMEKDIRKNDRENVVRDLERIDEATQKMEALLQHLLNLSRIGRIVNPPQDMPFAGIAKEAVELLDAPLRGRHVKVTIDPDMPTVCVDHVRVREVLTNLVENAIKFMGDQAHPEIHIGFEYDGGSPVFFVKDNGIGIDPGCHERIFRLFEKLDPGKEGSGAGLAIVKRIIEVHGGKIRVESEGNGSGSTFRFTLSPRVPEVTDMHNKTKEED